MERVQLDSAMSMKSAASVHQEVANNDKGETYNSTWNLIGPGERGGQPEEHDGQEAGQLLLWSKTKIQLGSETALPSIVCVPPS